MPFVGIKKLKNSLTFPEKNGKCRYVTLCDFYFG